MVQIEQEFLRTLYYSVILLLLCAIILLHSTVSILFVLKKNSVNFTVVDSRF